jgi:hypothetical protein
MHGQQNIKCSKPFYYNLQRCRLLPPFPINLLLRLSSEQKYVLFSLDLSLIIPSGLFHWTIIYENSVLWTFIIYHVFWRRVRQEAPACPRRRAHTHTHPQYISLYSSVILTHLLCVRSTVKRTVTVLPCFIFRRAKTELQKATISFAISLYPSAWNISAPTGMIFVKFNVRVFFLNLSGNGSIIKIL